MIRGKFVIVNTDLLIYLKILYEIEFAVKFLWILLLVLLNTPIIAQASDTLNVEIPSIVLSANRTQQDANTVALPINKSNHINDQKLYQQLSLQEYLTKHPGLFSQNANNFAQDLRISIRGFGARSAFGIRGVKLLVDGVPETTPDGQGQLDNLDLNSISNIEVIRGPNAALYGNAAGGTIHIYTQDRVEKPFIQLRSLIGSFGNFKTDVSTGLKFEKSNLILNSSYFRTKGFRNHSFGENFIFAAKWKVDLNQYSQVEFIGNHTNSPLAQDPGGISLEDAQADPQTARQANIDFNAGEAISHTKAAVKYIRTKKNSQFQSILFGHRRNFEGRLPFSDGGYIDLDRNFWGQSSFYQLKHKTRKYSHKTLIGFDTHFQNDQRQRFVNDLGIAQGLTLNQTEIFNTYAVFLSHQTDISKKLILDLNLRNDLNQIKLADRFFSDGDNSSEQSLNAFNYSLGIGYTGIAAFFPYLRLASSFETPSLSELSANPTSSGFNVDLESVRSINYELGIKLNPSKNYRIETNIFLINNSNEILPFELEAFPGRAFFRNTGATQRRGFEFLFEAMPLQTISTNLTYSFSNFQFSNFEVDGTNLEGLKLPGIPEHNIQIALDYCISQSTTIQLKYKHVGRLYADNENSVSVSPYNLIDLKGRKTFQFENLNLELFGGLNNLFNIQYFDNIRINAFGARFYEPAAERNAYIGVSLKWVKPINRQN